MVVLPLRQGRKIAGGNSFRTIRAAGFSASVIEDAPEPGRLVPLEKLRGLGAGRRQPLADLAVGTSVAVSGSVEERLGRLEERQRLLKDAVVRGFWQVMDRLDEAILPGRRMTCPICSTTEPRERLDARIDHCFFGGGRLERYVCPHCGCIFGPAKCLELNAGMLEADYALLYDGYAEADSTECEIRAFRSLLPVPAGPFLNWGCGRWSHSIPALRAEGHDVWGFEPSAPPGAQPFIATRREQISARFAGIFSNNVIEHMIRPVEEFRYFHSILLPGGRMAHASPCYRYAYSNTRFHVLFLTGDAPRILAERSGFRVLSLEEDGEFINHVFERIWRTPGAAHMAGAGRGRNGRAGTPPTTAPSCTSAMTADPAPITASWPMRMPGRTALPTPNRVRAPMVTVPASAHPGATWAAVPMSLSWSMTAPVFTIANAPTRVAVPMTARAITTAPSSTVRSALPERLGAGPLAVRSRARAVARRRAAGRRSRRARPPPP